MAVNDDLAARMRAILGAAGAVREVKMFGGLCFMLNGNMVVGTAGPCRPARAARASRGR
ncbi:MAG TPA: hypothetical protein VM755_22390 [Stellaceae bacterium]|nr:hypothetical protein [Stellaceae bacterium]